MNNYNSLQQPSRWVHFTWTLVIFLFHL
jgi:hypothetical protein